MTAFVVRASILRSLGQQTLSLRAAVFTPRDNPAGFTRLRLAARLRPCGASAGKLLGGTEGRPTKHHLDLLGSRSAVLRQLSSEVARSFVSGQLGQGGPFNEVYHMNGYMVRVTGAVVNGAPRISNAWVLRRMGT
jgi:hypothetical protein